jgi:predicted regulator of Ras-like GTPase activity (Roadblock/LC7/MglB family)
MREELQSLLEEVRTDIGEDFVATDVVGLDGMSVAGLKAHPEFDSETVSAHFAMVMKLASKVTDGGLLGGVHENQLNTDKAMIFSRFLGDGSFCWLLATTKDATLAFVRSLMDEYEMRLWGAIPT